VLLDGRIRRQLQLIIMPRLLVAADQLREELRTCISSNLNLYLELNLCLYLVWICRWDVLKNLANPYQMVTTNVQNYGYDGFKIMPRGATEVGPLPASPARICWLCLLHAMVKHIQSGAP
jgi:hypothetical protein